MLPPPPTSLPPLPPATLSPPLWPAPTLQATGARDSAATEAPALRKTVAWIDPVAPSGGGAPPAPGVGEATVARRGRHGERFPSPVDTQRTWLSAQKGLGGSEDSNSISSAEDATGRSSSEHPASRAPHQGGVERLVGTRRQAPTGAAPNHVLLVDGI